MNDGGYEYLLRKRKIARAIENLLDELGLIPNEEYVAVALDRVTNWSSLDLSVLLSLLRALSEPLTYLRDKKAREE